MMYIVTTRLQAKPKTGIDGGYDPSWRSFVSMTDATSGDLTTAKIKAASGYLRSGHYMLCFQKILSHERAHSSSSVTKLMLVKSPLAP